MPDGGVCANCAVLNEEMEAGDGADFLGHTRFDEDAADAEIANTSDVVAAFAAKVDPDVGRIQDAARDSFADTYTVNG